MLFSAGGRLCRGIIVTPTIFNPFAFDPADDVLQSGDDLRGGRLPADIVGAHEQDDVGHAVMGQHVAIEPVDAGRTVGRRL